MENKVRRNILTGQKADQFEMEQYKARMLVLLQRMDRLQAMLKMMKIIKPKSTDQETEEP